MAQTRDVGRASLYSAPINLWVEDEVTRTYLLEVWNDNPMIKCLIGGGYEGGHAIVKDDAETVGYPNVFSVVDRDFRQSNKHKWADPARINLRLFTLPVHEIEN